MSLPEYCARHEIHYPYGAQCPECRADQAAEQGRRLLEEQEEARLDAERRFEDSSWREEAFQRVQEERHQQLVLLRQQEIYKRQNPGDYRCPECLYTTLKIGASRCPTCHAAIPKEHWPPIYEGEKLLAVLNAYQKRLVAEERLRQEKLAAEEWAKGEPERQRRAKALVEEQERQRLEAEQAAAAAAQTAAQQRRNAAAREYGATGAGAGATLGGIVLGFSGCVSCLNNYRAQQTLLTDFNLFNGLLYGAIGGALIGASIGLMIAYGKD